jgi:hypothetical protein
MQHDFLPLVTATSRSILSVLHPQGYLPTSLLYYNISGTRGAPGMIHQELIKDMLIRADDASQCYSWHTFRVNFFSCSIHQSLPSAVSYLMPKCLRSILAEESHRLGIAFDRGSSWMLPTLIWMKFGVLHMRIIRESFCLFAVILRLIMTEQPAGL